MVRLIGAVVLGYIVIALVVFGGLSAAYLVLGAEGAFQPGIYAITTLWVVTSLVVGFAAGLLGGWVARMVARDVRGPWILAGVVLVLGLGMAVPALLGDASVAGARPDGIGMFDAIQQATTPGWILLLNPLVGAAGVVLGGGGLRTGRAAGRPVTS